MDLQSLEINWKLRPDWAAIFEFYDLENDFLLRGELGIYRIDKSGNLKWSYEGRDIWVNIDGHKEVEINNNQIILIDFGSNKYVIDFDGKTIKDLPIKKPKINSWWKLWK